MKTKKLFLMAAMLLMSVCSFAQNSNTPLKGDVNEDGKVDVADIAAVINIMKNGGGTTDGKLYFYVGTEKPTSLSQATIVNSYPAEYTFTNPSTTEKCYVYVLTNADKTVNFYDPSDPNTPTVKTEDTSTISGYKITSTGGRIAKGGDILIKITDAPMYYWYVGNTKPTSVDINNIQTSATEIGWHNMDTSASIINVGQCAANTSSTWYVCIPVINNSAFTKVLSGGVDVTGGFNITTESIGGESYTIFQKIETSKKFKYDFSK